jgi:hypothetical protein
MNLSHREVSGICPACGYPTLFLGSGGHVTCSRLTCPRPTTADEILGERESGHLVDIDEFDYSMVHPLIERLDNALLDCDLAKYMRSLDGPPVEPGRYRVTWAEDDWTWESLT